MQRVAAEFHRAGLLTYYAPAYTWIALMKVFDMGSVALSQLELGDYHIKEVLSYNILCYHPTTDTVTLYSRPTWWFMESKVGMKGSCTREQFQKLYRIY